MHTDEKIHITVRDLRFSRWWRWRRCSPGLWRLEPSRWRQYVSPKCWYLHGVTSHKKNSVTLKHIRMNVLADSSKASIRWDRGFKSRSGHWTDLVSICSIIRLCVTIKACTRAGQWKAHKAAVQTLLWEPQIPYKPQGTEQADRPTDRLSMPSQRDPVDCYPPIRLRFCSTAVDPPPNSWPKY
jgi:hypothetical protein